MFFVHHQTELVPWPAHFPDLSPIVAQRLTQITLTAATPDQLWDRVEAAWSAVPQEHIQSLFELMPRRVTAPRDYGYKTWPELSVEGTENPPCWGVDARLMCSGSMSSLSRGMEPAHVSSSSPDHDSELGAPDDPVKKQSSLAVGFLTVHCNASDDYEDILFHQDPN
ncbi:transposable element Tcb1 transposase [Trichonephila clavipes]|nr:transposable element Tcb1 transposase [Trichonephila clavipes]